MKPWFPALAFTCLAIWLWSWLRTDYGISWDQTVDLKFGQAVHAYFTNGLNLGPISEYPVKNLIYYSPLVGLLAATVADLLHWDIYASGAAVTGLFWVATFWPVCMVALFMAGRAGAWFSGLALLGMPAYLGHAFINAKDLPFACAMAWFLLAVLWCLKNEQFSLRESLIAGFAYGFVLAIRPGGFFVGALLFLPLFKRLCLGKYPLKTCLRILIRGFGFILLAVLVAWAVMISPWPSAHRDPLFHPIESMRLASSFNESYPVLFLGKMHQSASLPWYYFFLFLGVTTPLAILLLATLGQIRLCADLRFDSKTWSSIGILFLIWFPLTTFVVLRMNVYDGLRHFLFLLPLLAICCGVGSSWLYEKLPIQSQWKRATLITALLLISVPSLVVLHPYQYTYYNVLAGPRITLHERFETDYWVTSYREAAKWINSQNLSAPRVVLAANSFSEPAFLHFASEQTQFVSLLGNYTSASLPRETDFYVGTVRYRQDQNFPSAPIHKRIERNGVLMSVIRKPRSGPLDSNEMR